MGNNGLAAAAYNKAIKLNPNAHMAHYGLALIFEAGGNKGLAIEQLKKSLSIKYETPPVQHKLLELQVSAGTA